MPVTSMNSLPTSSALSCNQGALDSMSACMQIWQPHSTIFAGIECYHTWQHTCQVTLVVDSGTDSLQLVIDGANIQGACFVLLCYSGC